MFSPRRWAARCVDCVKCLLFFLLIPPFICDGEICNLTSDDQQKHRHFFKNTQVHDCQRQFHYKIKCSFQFSGMIWLELGLGGEWLLKKAINLILGPGYSLNQSSWDGCAFDTHPDISILKYSLSQILNRWEFLIELFLSNMVIVSWYWCWRLKKDVH